MQRYLFARLAQSLLILIGLLVIVFFMVRVTGDPASLMMSREASPESIAAFRHKMGFDRPLVVQFWDFLTHVVVGDFGNSLHFKTPALPLLLERLPATVELATIGLIMAMLIAIPLGLIGGFNPGSPIDSIGRGLALFGQSIPNFWLALILILFFAVKLRWFPSFGRDEFKSVILPAFVLGLPTMGQLVRMTRSAVLEIRGEDFVRTAHSKGLEPRVIYIKHVLRNVAVMLVSVIGVQYSYMLGGSIYIEAVFAWPGMGRLFLDAVGVMDFPVIIAWALVTASIFLVMNLAVDILYVYLDPRIRHEK